MSMTEGRHSAFKWARLFAARMNTKATPAVYVLVSFSTSAPIAAEREGQGGVGPTTTRKLKGMKAVDPPKLGWGGAGRDLHDCDYTLPVTLAAQLGPRINAAQTSFAFDVEQRVDYRQEHAYP